jgi:hypothetical protein
MQMSLAAEITEYDDVRVRKALARAIAAHQAKAGELTELRASIGQAEAKL